MTKFSIAMGVGPREPVLRVAEIAKAMESYGFHAFWIQDNPLITKDAYVALTIAGMSTSRLILAPGVSTPIVRHPTVIVNGICTLDNLTEGRVVLGLGSGGPALVIPMGEKPEPIEAFRRTLTQIQTLLKGEEVVTPRSTRYGVASARRPVPVYVAAGGPRMLQLAGELADGVVIGGAAQKEEFAEKIGLVQKGALSSGRNPRDVQISIMLTAIVNPDPRAALEDAKRFTSVRGRGVPSEYERVMSKARTGLEHNPESDSISDAVASTATVAGDEAQCLEHLRPILSLEPHEVIFRLLTGGRMQRLETLAGLISHI